MPIYLESRGVGSDLNPFFNHAYLVYMLVRHPIGANRVTPTLLY